MDTFLNRRSQIYNVMVSTGIYSDFTIKCYGTKFNVHKKILEKYDYFKKKFYYSCDCDELEINSKFISLDRLSKPYHDFPNIDCDTKYIEYTVKAIEIILKSIYDCDFLNEETETEDLKLTQFGLKQDPIDVENTNNFRPYAIHNNLCITLICFRLCNEFCLIDQKQYFCNIIFKFFSTQNLLQYLYKSKYIFDGMYYDYRDTHAGYPQTYHLQNKYGFIVQLHCTKEILKIDYPHKSWSKDIIDDYGIILGKPNRKEFLVRYILIKEISCIVNNDDELKKKFYDENFIEFSDIISNFAR